MSKNEDITHKRTFFLFISNCLSTLAPHHPAKPWTYYTGFVGLLFRMTKKLATFYLLLTKTTILSLYNTMNIYSHVETGLGLFT